MNVFKKSTIFMCIAFSFMCNADAPEIQKSRWQSCIEYVKKSKKVLGASALALAYFCGAAASGSQALKFKYAFESNMDAGHSLNAAWVSLLKQHPDLDLAPSIQKNIDLILSNAKDLDATQLANLKTYMHNVLDKSKELPGDFLIDKAVDKLPDYYACSISNYLGVIAFFGALALVVYEVKQLFKKPSEQDAKKTIVANEAE